jgi:outer membrane protein OmpA-like peptidoglycan-associated protein
MTLIALASLAHAQSVPEINAQLFRPSIDSSATLWTDESLMSPDKYTLGRATLHYVNDPFVYMSASGERTELVSGLWQLNAAVAHTRGPVRLGVDVPIYLRSNGLLGGETGLGDIGVDARFTALDRREKPLGLALAGRLSAPTSTVDAPLGGGLGWELAVIADTELGDDTVLAANLGTKGVKNVQLDNFEYRDQLFLRAGVGHALSESAGVSLDWSSHFTYGAFGEPGGRPSEVLLGGWKRVGGDWVVRGGAGTGLSSGIGSPKFRALVSVSYEPPREDVDTDGDGILDKDDACVDTPEDLDGVADTDGCPEATQVSVRVVDEEGKTLDGASWTLGEASGTGAGEIELYGGSYTVSAQAEGRVPSTLTVDVPDAISYEVQVPIVLIPGRLMVSAIDDAGNAVPEAVWTIRSEKLKNIPAGEPYEVRPGTYSIVVEAPAYKPVKRSIEVVTDTEEVVQLTLEPSQATVKAEKIEIADSVYFETAKAVIKTESHSLLQDVAAILNTHPEITKLRIEGHTDSRGNDATNKVLSQERADAVKAYLVSQGVEASRLETVGYGEEKPLDTAENKAAWAKNRRVDFFIAAQEE